MKFYQLNTIFSFGRHEGESLLHVFMEDSEYISWCQAYLDHFFLSDRVIGQLQDINPEFTLSNEAIQKRNRIHEEWLQEQKEMKEREEDSRWEREVAAMDEEMGSYSPYTEEYGEIDNFPDFSIDPFDDQN